MNNSKHIWKGWTVQDFISDLKPMFGMIIRGESWIPVFRTKKRNSDMV